jgi:nucleotide-binding universal stress UspA family protein
MIYERVLVGFDGSPASERALEQALALKAPQGRLQSLTVAETYYATHAGMDARQWDAQLRAAAEEARRHAAAALEGVEGSGAAVTAGNASHALLHDAERLDADLIALGAHGHSRLAGLLLGSVATQVIHDARCSVLVARGTETTSGFPRAIVVGIDGSDYSARAAAVAEALAAPRQATLSTLEAKSPVEALVEASRTADLVVVGTRGAHGIASLGSVAERVAHQAECSVLIVRGQQPAPTAHGRAARPSPEPRVRVAR